MNRSILPLLAVLAAAILAAAPGPAHPDRVDDGRESDPAARLERALDAYRDLAAAGGWGSVPGGPALALDSAGPRVAALRSRLALTDGGTLLEAPEADRFDEDLDAAVRRFQERHGLEMDGIVGVRTLAALNVPPGARVRQMRLNVDRMRALPPDTSRARVIVNVPAFSLTLSEGGSQVLELRVIVGRPSRPTPEVSGRIETVVFNPTWTVPPTIERHDLLLRVRRDPDYLTRNGIRVFTGYPPAGREVDPAAVDWSAVTPGTYVYRQDPGSTNPLGRVKLLFPTPYHVALHDTPDRHLLAQTDRALSSGCIRVERAEELAERLLRTSPEPWRERRAEAERRGREASVPVAPPVPIHLVYWTAWVGADGRIHFRSDLYGRDARALAGPELGGARGPDSCEGSDPAALTGMGSEASGRPVAGVLPVPA